ncbi:hypothetical protein C4573_07270 [Candidatus Woesearchaeota archaeon]|nr:MAG: hypothetical protein C4573_07270 [Candidatus Woesearchaeota archaeon]
MIQQSFIFLKGIGIKGEKNLWKQGIADWTVFLERKKIKGISEKRKEYYDAEIRKAKRALLADNSVYFANILQKKEHYRLWNYFKDSCLFLDIEGNRKKITLIGLYDGYDVKTILGKFGVDKQQFFQYLSQFKIIVTFNGNTYDLPALEHYFGEKILLPAIDLRHVCNKAGLKGSLKAIEKQAGIARKNKNEGVLAELNPEDYAYQCDYKAERHIKRLVNYNEEDVVNLKFIAEYALKQMYQAKH